MWIQAPEERIWRALNRETKDEGPSATTSTGSITSATGKDLEENSMKEDSTKSSSSFELTVAPQAIVPEPAMVSESQALPPNQQPPASLPLLFGADVQSVPGTSLNPAPLQLSSLNSGSAVAIPPIQQPLGPDIQSVPGTSQNPEQLSTPQSPPQLLSLNTGSAVVTPPIQ